MRRRGRPEAERRWRHRGPGVTLWMPQHEHSLSASRHIVIGRSQAGVARVAEDACRLLDLGDQICTTHFFGTLCARARPPPSLTDMWCGIRQKGAIVARQQSCQRDRSVRRRSYRRTEAAGGKRDGRSTQAERWFLKINRVEREHPISNVTSGTEPTGNLRKPTLCCLGRGFFARRPPRPRPWRCFVS